MWQENPQLQLFAVEGSVLNWVYVQAMQSTDHQQLLENHYRHLRKLLYVQKGNSFEEQP